MMQDLTQPNVKRRIKDWPGHLLPPGTSGLQRAEDGQLQRIPVAGAAERFQQYLSKCGSNEQQQQAAAAGVVV